jgi:hypothetical protein
LALCVRTLRADAIGRVVRGRGASAGSAAQHRINLHRSQFDLGAGQASAAACSRSCIAARAS